MSVLKIYSMSDLEHYTGDFSLRKKSRELSPHELETDWFRKLVFDMFETLYADPSGVGLAAPQIGMHIKLAVIDVRRDAKKPLVLINPSYEVLNKEQVLSKEACLSIPYYSGEVERNKSIKVKALDLNGKSVELIGENFLSFVFQHEIDHLNGILYIDRILDKSKLIPNQGYCYSLAERAINSLC